MGAAYAGGFYALCRDVGVLRFEIDIPPASVKSMDTLGALALRLDGAVSHEDF